MTAAQTPTFQRPQGVPQQILAQILRKCDVELNGSRPFDLQLKNSLALNRIVRQGSLGLGESYMDGDWECEQIDVLVTRLLRLPHSERFANTYVDRWLALMSRLRNLQSRGRAGIVAKQHYDIGNELYEVMLDSYMNYSCGYWETADTLEQAQQDKMELLCRKLELAPGMRVLDIGCGWGGAARYAVEHYGVRVVGVTISRQQSTWARTRLKDMPIEILCQDYREVRGNFDRILSVGMFEHVGYKNYATFFDGLLLLHTIGCNASAQATDLWLHRYIFPNGVLPSVAQIGRAIEEQFVMEDWQNFGPYYDRTLMAWYRRITDAWGALGDRYDERFRRMWSFYLLACAGAFRARHTQLWQVVLSKGSRSHAYQRPTLA